MSVTRAGDQDPEPTVLESVGPLELHDGLLRIHETRGVIVVVLDGGLDHAYASTVIPTIRSTLGELDAAVLDLDRVAMLDEEALGRVVAAFTDATQGAERCVVASRLSARLVLERSGFIADLPIFATVADALQARAFAQDGYGAGWSGSDA